MATVETITFRLRPGADEAAFEQADKQFQVGFTYQQAGIIRRTTARGSDGAWIAIEVWEADSDADAALHAYSDSPLVADFMAFIDDDSVVTRRFRTVE